MYSNNIIKGIELLRCWDVMDLLRYTMYFLYEISSRICKV